MKETNRGRRGGETVRVEGRERRKRERQKEGAVRGKGGTEKRRDGKRELGRK